MPAGNEVCCRPPVPLWVLLGLSVLGCVCLSSCPAAPCRWAGRRQGDLGHVFGSMFLPGEWANTASPEPGGLPALQGSLLFPHPGSHACSSLAPASWGRSAGSLVTLQQCGKCPPASPVTPCGEERPGCWELCFAAPLLRVPLVPCPTSPLCPRGPVRLRGCLLCWALCRCWCSDFWDALACKETCA